MKYLRAFLMRWFRLVSRESFDDLLRHAERLSADRARAIADLREAYDQIESLSASLRMLRVHHSTMALRSALKDAENVHERN